MTPSHIVWLESVGIGDIASVGGKNASLGEMLRSLKTAEISVPNGFAVTAAAYWDFIRTNGLEQKIALLLSNLKNKRASLPATGASIRRLILKSPVPNDLAEAIKAAYRDLSRKCDQTAVDVAVRSSATAEDLPDASFAGQQETFLNIVSEEALLKACRKCYASLFTNRAISYREQKGFDHLKVALSIGVQKMVRSDLACSGVMFTLDTDTGFPDVVVINAAWGLGENVVQGTVTPDEYVVFKPLLEKKELNPIIEKTLGDKALKMIYAKTADRPTRNVRSSPSERSRYVLTDPEILQLSRWAEAIERHYGKPMDMEWAKDGKSHQLFIVQARPETVQSRKKAGVLKTYALKQKGKKLLQGSSVGDMIAAGPAQIIKDVKEIARFREGSILVTGATDPDWVPIMKKAAGIITDHGGRTSHAAIVSRELGIPAVVGTGRATSILKEGRDITVSCAEGDEGFVYDGRLQFEEAVVDMAKLPKTRTQLMLNIASPEAAFHWWHLPCRGIGLARMEFIINDIIKIHPMALVHFERVKDIKDRRLIMEMTHGFKDKTEYFVEHLARGIAKIAASRYPDPVIVRMSDFKTNEYANLIGGRIFEPHEENPMLGFRGASRYYNDKYREGFALECRAVKRVREDIGLTNVLVMIPFCRTVEEADQVLKVMEEFGLKRGEHGLQVYVMCEIPSNVILADRFAARFDGFSIGSNDLTQLMLGVDRDSAELATIFDERNDAVKIMIQEVIARAHLKGCKVGICGQAPSDHADFAEFLVRAGIDSISLNPDSVIPVLRRVAKLEEELTPAKLTTVSAGV